MQPIAIVSEGFAVVVTGVCVQILFTLRFGATQNVGMERIVQDLLSVCGDKSLLVHSEAIEGNALYFKVLSSAVDLLFEHQSNVVDPQLSANLVKIGILYDSTYNRLHTGQWSTVKQTDREFFTILCFVRIVYTLILSKDTELALKDGIYLADMGLMLGSRIAIDQKDSAKDLLTEAASILTKHLANVENETPPLKRIKLDENLDNTSDTDEPMVPVFECPSLEFFGTHCYIAKQPALLRGIIKDWPAMERWHDPNYLLSVAGERTVPIEFGSQYSNEDWSQKLMKFREFVEQNICENPPAAAASSSANGAAYLAQHDLFDQVPALRRDISVPDYVGSTDINPRIKAWLGPKGTISPLHTDPCHNLLCQVFGSKTIILARPEDTDKLYPHEHFILSNTSQLDARCPNFERFPLARQVRFQRVTLRRGEVLYIPPKWWHYVESLSPSFSVSFWFE